MVNIRASLIQAEADDVLSRSSRRALEDLGKSLFFPQRTWEKILGQAAIRGVAQHEIAKFRGWLPRGRVDQKRTDALEMLAEMKRVAESTEQLTTKFHFEWTSLWDKFMTRMAWHSSPIVPSIVTDQRAVLNELRLEGIDAYERVKDRALLRLYADLEAKRLGLQASPEAKRASLGRLREALGLFTYADLESWLQRNHLDRVTLERLIEAGVRAQAAIGSPELLPDRYLLDELRLGGYYERLAERARQKQQLRARLEQVAPGVNASVPNEAALRIWYFEQRLKKPLPEDVAAFAREIGCANLNEFDDVLRSEWLYTNGAKRL